MVRSRSGRSGKNASVPARIGFALSCLLLIALTVAGSSALADEGEQAPVPSGPSLQQIEESLSGEGPTPTPIEPTNPEAAEELPHTELNRAEAGELLTAVFGSVLQGAAGVFDELEVDDLHGDHVAVIAPDDQPEINGSPSDHPTLLESAVPLRAQDESGKVNPIDLSLESSEGELQSANPLVEVGIPFQLGDGISLPETGVEIDLPGVLDRSVSMTEDATALYPNVAEDSDFVVAPTPEGVETFSQLRSADTPRIQTYELTLPQGARLKETSDGGAEVLDDEEPIMEVPAPTAIDAEGGSVPVSLKVDGNSLIIATTPDIDTAYPILVDPYFQVYTFGQTGAQGKPDFTGWSAFNTNSGAFATSISAWCPACNDIVYGLEINSFPASGIPIQSRARWDYMVPRWGKDHGPNGEILQPSTYIDGLQFGRLYFDVMAPQNNYAVVNDPLFEFYMWDDSLGFVAIGRRLGTEGNLNNLSYPYALKNPNHNVNTKRASLELVTTQPHSQYRHLYVGDASIELTDNDNPAISFAGSTGWVNSTASSAIPFEASDMGLGMYEMQAKVPTAIGSQTVATLRGCTGGAASPCPREWTSSNGPTLKYDPLTMPQGENWIPITAVDGIGRTSGAKDARVKVDHTAPGLSLSGSLTEQATLGTSAPQYTLKYNATDGDSAPAEALSPFGAVGTGPGQFQRPGGVAVNTNGEIFVSDKLNSRVMKFDSTGKFLLQFGSPGSGNGQFSTNLGIATSSNGTVWVADWANRRVQQFTAAGVFIRKIDLGSSSSPYAVATGPNETLWIVDQTAKKVWKYKEDGTLLGFAKGSQSAPGGEATDLLNPVGAAVDALGNVWVADQGNEKIRQFSAAGKFVSEFGTPGTASGQLFHPRGIAITASGNIAVTDEANRVQEFESSGAFAGRQFGTNGSATGQLFEPQGLAVGPGNQIYVGDAGNKRIARWAHADNDPQSGVAKVEVKVDGGTPKVLYNQACAIKDCAKASEWAYTANEYATGQHSVVVMAADGVNLPTSKTITINSIKDTTPPQLTATSTLFTAPEGWLEQKTYSYSASAKDVGGRGVASLILKVDGKVVKTTSGTCLSGGCEKVLSGSIDMSNYAGGAHPAELVATDGAGLSTKKNWTINVDPRGSISFGEAEDTLEAVEATASVNTIGAAAAELDVEGSAPGMGVEQGGIGQLKTTGTVVPTTISTSAQSEARLEVVDGEVYEEGSDNDGTLLEPVEIEPLSVSQNSTGAVVVDSDAAAVVANVGTHVDLISRPLYDGLMQSAAIRDVSAPEEYSWRVKMEPDQELVQTDPQHAVVYWDGREHVAVGIEAQAAHDALGKAVPTMLRVDGPEVITLVVKHRSAPPNVGAFTYPVVAGTGWEGGYQVYEAVMPPPEPIEGPPGEENGEEVEASSKDLFMRRMSIGPPVHEFDSTALSATKIVPKRKFYANECPWTGVDFPEIPAGKRTQVLTSIRSQQCHGTLDFGPYGIGHVRWAIAISGRFGYEWGKEVWPVGGPNCNNWGEEAEQGDKQMCKFASWSHQSEHVDALMGYRWNEGVGGFLSPGAHCLELDAVLPASPKYLVPTTEKVWRARYHLYRVGLLPGDPCPWRHFPSYSEVH